VLERKGEERRGEEAASPNLSALSVNPILDYLQRDEYSPKWGLLDQVAHILILV
jgi:hypothetical protein